MELRELQRNWDLFGKTDPLWAILSQPDKRNNKWDLREFFFSGRAEIARVLERIASKGITFKFDRALDFGCGVGRLTQALCEHFSSADGVDIAPSMIEQAHSYNRHGPRCRYHLNETDHLGIFPDAVFDFIYSNIVLQHMRPEYSQRYMTEFLRILKPGGLALFQLPSRLVDITGLPYRAAIHFPSTSLRACPNAAMTLDLTIQNESAFVWPMVSVGNHWLDALGELVQRDDGRTVLAAGLGPQQSIAAQLHVRTPTRPGNYLLELDLVHEEVTWFADKGSKTTRVPCQILGRQESHQHLWRPVRTALRSLPGYRLAAHWYRDRRREISSAPAMEMYGIPTEELVTFLERHGGRVVAMEEDHSVGGKVEDKVWQSHCYYVIKLA